VTDVDLDQVRSSYVRRAVETAGGALSDDDADFVAEDTRWTRERVLAEARGAEA
jgi:hypothetical protein